MDHLTLLNGNASGFTQREFAKIDSILRPLSGGVIPTSSPDEMRRILKLYSGRLPRILGIGGGDNTIPEVLTAVKEIWGNFPEYLALFPMGAVCNWATSFGLNDGIVDKTKKGMGFGETKALLMARYIREVYDQGGEFMVEALQPLNVNNRLGFNFGAGGVAKLIWMYEGKNPKEYSQLEKRLAKLNDAQDIEKTIHEALEDKGLLDSVARAASNGNGNLIRRNGSTYPLVTVLLSILSDSPLSMHHGFYGQCFDGKVYLDNFGYDFTDINAFYASAYDKVNFGIPLLNVVASPKAREKDKIEVIFCRTSVANLARQLPQLISGKKVEGLNYHSASSMVLRSERPIIYEFDAGIHAERVITVCKEAPLNVISPCQGYTNRDHLRHFLR